MKAYALAVVALALALSCATTAEKKKSDTREAPDEPWRSTRPPAGPAPELELPAFQSGELKNGMALMVLEDHSLPMITAAVVVRGGSAQDGKDAGLAALTYELLDENTLAEAMAWAELGANVDTETTAELGIVRVELLKKHADAGVELLANTIRKPTFAQADLDRVRARMVARGNSRDANAVAASVASALVYGGEHPYGHDRLGTAATLEKLTLAKARKFWSEVAGPKNSALFISGDITLDEAKALADKAFGKWTGSAKAPKSPVDVEARTALTLAMVDVPGAPRTTIHVAGAGVAHGDPEEAAVLVLNEVVRERLQAQRASTTTELRKARGLFALSSEVESANTGDALAAMLKELEAVKTGATDAEVVKARDAYVKSIPGRLPRMQVHAAATMFAYELPPDYFAKLVEGMNAVNAEAVKKLAARVIVKEDLVIVLVGDRASVEPKVAPQNLGELTAYGRDGVVIKQ